MRAAFFTVLAVTLVAGANPALAQMPEKEPYIGITGGGVFPLTSWDLGKNATEDELEAGTSAQVGLRLGYHLTSQLAVEAGAQWMPLSLHPGTNNGFIYNGDLLFHFIKADWSPFVLLGAGAYHSAGGDLGSDVDFQAHAGLGVRGLVLDWLALRLELRDVLTDGHGSAEAIAGNNLELTAGLDIFPRNIIVKDLDEDGTPDETDKCPSLKGVPSAQGCPDADGDSVTDAEDACLDVPGKIELRGCPDQDGDGLVDGDDACPFDTGILALKGCPDQDGDGTADKDDVCPDQAGLAAHQGCPDQDGDGLADREDKCPAEKGPATTQGCPDQDGDQIPDAEDACPEAAGKPSLKGCPDQDGDTVADHSDKCPAVRGLVEYEGCLPPEAAKFTGAIKGINFASGKAKLLPNSFKLLDQAVEVLKKFPSMRIKIEGHTDDRGSAETNKKLSQERAEAVQKYLIDKGIDPSRLQAWGFGSERPIADNKTAKGRTENRRVEFNLIEQ